MTARFDPLRSQEELDAEQERPNWPFAIVAFWAFIVAGGALAVIAG